MPGPWLLGGEITEATLDAVLEALEARRGRTTVLTLVARPTLGRTRRIGRRGSV